MQKLSNEHTVVAPSRDQLDLSDFDAIDRLDLSDYDIVINCAGANPGAYMGWQNNSWHNQVTQVNVNFTGALLLIKQYTRQRNQGQVIYITSTNVDDPIAYNIFYTASKMALRYSVNTLRKEFPKIVFTEICPGKVKTNMIYQNYQGTKTPEEIEHLYSLSPNLDPSDIANLIELTLKYSLDKVVVNSHDKTRI